MTSSEYDVRMQEWRENLEDFGRTIDGIGGDGGFVPSQDPEFWRDFDRIERAGRDKKEAEAPWLASLTQVDDLGPNGRAMFLAIAALDALRQMPTATLAVGKTLSHQLAPDASRYIKVSLCKVLEASASAEAIPFLEKLAGDEETYVRSDCGWCLEKLRAELERLARSDGPARHPSVR